MALESGTTIDSLVATNPVSSDPLGQADDHMRLIKTVLKTTFAGITGVADEDDMSSDSAAKLATQQSIKAYVDGQFTASDLDFQGDSGGALSIDLDSETLTVAGGTGIDTSGSSNTLTVAIDSTVATLTGSQVLTNKTLTSPVLNTAVSGTAILDEDDLSSDSATQLATQQSIKAYVDSQVTAQDLDLTSDSGTIAIDLDSESLTVAGGTGIDSSATSNTVTLAIDSTVVQKDATQTLTNKTLTSPTLNTPTIGTSFTIGSATITEAELEVLDGATLTTTELNYVDGVTSAIQTQLDAKAPIATPTFTTSITIGSATISEAELEILDGATLTTAELNVLDGITSTVSELNILDGVTSTATELNVMDGDTAASSTTLADADRVVVNDAGTMKQVALTDFETYFETSLDTLSNVTSVGTLTSLTISGDLTVDTNTLKVDSSNNRVGINQASPDVSFDAGANTDAVHLPTGTTAQRPGSPAAGYFRYNSELSQFEGYTDEWGQIGGGGGSNTFQTDTFTTANDSTTDFTLSQAVEEADTIIFIDGVFQAQNAYSISGTTLTLSAAPASGRVVTAYSVKSAVGGSNFSIATMTGDNSDVTLTLPVNAVHKNNVHIMWDGVTQSKANYDIDAAGTTVTFTTAPPTGVHVEAIVATATSISTAAQVVDADLDTKIQVEESSDEDKIRFDTGGTERMVLDSNGLKLTTPLTIGVDDTGHDVTLYGATSGRYVHWDESNDSLDFKDSVYARFGTGNDLNIYHDGSHSMINAASGTGALKLKSNDIRLENASANNVLKAVGDGYVTMPLQPSVGVNKDAQNNFAPDYDILVGLETERHDNNSDFGSSTFNAPVTGKYLVCMNLYLTSVDSAAAFYELQTISTNKTYYSIIDPDFGQDANYFTLNWSGVIDMDASDTVVFRVRQSGGSTQTDISIHTYASITLLN